MKKYLSCKHIALFICLLFIFNIIYANTIKLNDAIKSKKIDCIIRGNSNSTHYLEPIVLELKNNTLETINIYIENGDLFIPSDTNKQNIVVTSNDIIVIQPKQKKIVNVKGMCTEHSDASGNNETIYTFASDNNDKLKKLTNFIAEKKYQTSTAQYAVWCLMNDMDINSIYGADSTEENELKKFVSKLTGKTYAIKTKEYRFNYYTPPREKVGGNFEYSFSKPQDIQIAMFDKNGILIRELFNQKKVAAGEHKLHFEYDASVYTDAVYYFKLIVDNEVLVNTKWDAKAMRDAFKNKIENKIGNRE